MIYANFGGIRDLLKQDPALEFCRNQNKDISIITKTHINHNHIHHTRSNWLGSIFFSLGDGPSKRLPLLLLSDFECVTDFNTCPEGEFFSFKVTPFNDKVLYYYAPLGQSTREQLTTGRKWKIKLRKMKAD